MKYRTIGDTGLEVSVLGMDVWANAIAVSTSSSESDKIRFLQDSCELGITLFDLGDFQKENYGENLLNKALNQNRHEIVVSSKCVCNCVNGQNIHAIGANSEDFSTEFIRRSCEDRLRALGTDYIDIYLIHCMPDHIYLHDRDIWLEELRSLVKEGKVRHIGVSTDVEQALMDKYLNSHADVIQTPYSILDRALFDGLAQNNDITNNSVLCKDPSGQMLLSEVRLLGIDSDLRKRVNKIRELALSWDIKAEKIAVEFCLRNPYSCSILPVVEDISSVRGLCEGLDGRKISDELMLEAETV